MGSTSRDGQSWCRARDPTATTGNRVSQRTRGDQLDVAVVRSADRAVLRDDTGAMRRLYQFVTLDPRAQKELLRRWRRPEVRRDIGEFFLRAYDPKTGAKKKWKYPIVTPTADAWAGTVSTAGGVVFGRRSSRGN